jgi:Uma2 family endonuclease
MSRAHSTISRSEVSDELVHPGRKLSEEEFIDWVGDGWAEWVNGEVIIMSPVNFEHAELHFFLLGLFGVYVSDHDLGTVVAEPFQIRFDFAKSRRSPDIIFISNKRRKNIRYAHLEGAPDLIVEIISPDSQSRDRREKFLEYQRAGVREYWIIDPLSEKVEAYRLGKDGKYILIAERDGRIHSTVLPKFYLKPAWLWREKLPKISTVLREINRR